MKKNLEIFKNIEISDEAAKRIIESLDSNGDFSILNLNSGYFLCINGFSVVVDSRKNLDLIRVDQLDSSNHCMNHLMVSRNSKTIWKDCLETIIKKLDQGKTVYKCLDIYYKTRQTFPYKKLETFVSKENLEELLIKIDLES